MYQILIRDKKNFKQYSFFEVKKEIMKEETQQVDDGTGNMIDKVIEIPTGQYKIEPFSTSDKDEFEAKCVELFKTYNLEELKFIDNLEYDTDIIWK